MMKKNRPKKTGVVPTQQTKLNPPTKQKLSYQLNILIVISMCLLGFTACDSSPTKVMDPGFTLNYPRANWGETLTATLQDLDASQARASFVTDAGADIDIPINNRTENTVSFVLPKDDALVGIQRLRIASGQYQAFATVQVFNAVDDKVDVFFASAVTQEDAKVWSENRGYSLENFASLAGEGPCSSKLAAIDVAGTSLGKALADMASDDLVLNADPRGRYSFFAASAASARSTSLTHLTSTGALSAHAKGMNGEGVTIAVLDTGVSPVMELKDRLLEGVSFIGNTNSTNALDDFDDPATETPADGHGTAVAVLAAGSTLGVAPKARVLPIKVCDAKGECLASDIVEGICHALNTVPNDSLVLNLSLGGDTPITLLETLLTYAAEQGTVTVAAAGNQREFGSPTHYPAAFDLVLDDKPVTNPKERLLAVASVSPAVPTCETFDNVVVDDVPVGTVLTTDPMKIMVDSYVLEGVPPLLEPPFENGYVISRDGAIDLTKATLNIELPAEVVGLQLDLNTNSASSTGNVNLEVNGEFVNPATLAELDGMQLGSGNKKVLLALASSDNDSTSGKQTLYIAGNLQKLRIGAANLIVDNICTLPSNWEVSAFSNRGEYVDIATVGENVTSLNPAGALQDYTGTSFATPIVSGALALWRQQQPDASPAEIVADVLANATALNLPATDVGKGFLTIPTP